MRTQQTTMHRFSRSGFIAAAVSVWIFAFGAQAARSAAGQERPELALGSAVSDADLAALRGKDGSVTLVNEPRITGSVENNQITGSETGSNSISDQALSGIEGFAIVIQNTGNQVVIQTDTIVNVHIDAAPP